MADEPDGIDEALEGMLRVGLTAAGRLAEAAARAREEAARQAQQASEAQARDLAARLSAERAAARVQLAPVDRPEWWDAARVDDVARMWETAASWQGLDPVAERAAARIRDEVRSRRGVDVDAPGADPAAVRDLLERGGAAGLGASAGGQRADGRRREQAAAAVLLAAADRADRADQPAGPSRPLADARTGTADAETVAARLLADAAQARPPEQAVTSPAAPAARSRRGQPSYDRARGSSLSR